MTTAQCLDTNLHPPHDFCPGLDGHEVAAQRALGVPCEECLAPPGTECRSNTPGTTHQSRQRLADLRALEKGTCGLCGAFMVYGSVLGSPLDAWHPDETEALVCPPMPDPQTDWNGYATQINAGVVPGHPGLEHFRPTVDPEKVCPECRQGKCGNCTFTVPVGETLEVLPCPCGTAGHPPLALQ